MQPTASSESQIAQSQSTFSELQIWSTVFIMKCEDGAHLTSTLALKHTSRTHACHLACGKQGSAHDLTAADNTASGNGRRDS